MGKMLQNLSSAAVVIGVLRVKGCNHITYVNEQGHCLELRDGIKETNREFYMSAHVLLNLLNELGKQR